jgi:hypothetical protein
VIPMTSHSCTRTCTHTVRNIVLLAATMWLIGCGRPATEIKGVVTLDGVAIPDATLDFFPVSGVGRVSVAKTNDQGQYHATVSPEKLSVVVLATKVIGKIPDRTEGGLTDDIRSVVPEQYRSHATTPLTADPVAGQTTTIDFALTSK